MHPVIGIGLSRIGKEPGIVELIRVIFREIPFAINPHLAPVVVAPVVVPVGRTRDARGNTHGTEGIGEEDGQAATRGHALADGLRGILIGFLAGGVVIHLHLIADVTVDGVDGLAKGFAVGHVGSKTTIKVGPPFIAFLVEGSIGQHLVEEDGVRKRLGPGETLASLVSKPNVSEQEVARQ